MGRKFRCPRGKVRNCAIYFARPRPKLVRIVSWRCRPPEVPVCGHGTDRKGREKSIGSFRGTVRSVLLCPHVKKKCSSQRVSRRRRRRLWEQERNILSCVRERGPHRLTVSGNICFIIQKQVCVKATTLGKQDSGPLRYSYTNERERERGKEPILDTVVALTMFQVSSSQS